MYVVSMIFKVVLVDRGKQKKMENLSYTREYVASTGR